MQAQNDGKIRVKGVVLDETTRQPIAFANIGIIGTAAVSYTHLTLPTTPYV